MLFQSIFKVTGLRDLIANAVRLSPLRRGLGLLGAATAMSCALFVIGRRVGSEKDLPVDLAANRQVTNGMAKSVCNVCLKEMRRSGHSGRRVFRTPIEVTQDPAFHRKGVPARLCPVCDGAAYEMTMRAYEARTGNSAETDA
jgi:hypothetical protein